MAEAARGRRLDVLAALLGLVVLAAWLRPAADRPLTWDEVDYVVAARAGAWANLWDQGALAPVPFVRFALAKAGRGDPQAVADAAGYVEDENLLHVRHWHPPAGILLLPPAVTAAGPERGARLSQLAWAAVLAAVLVGFLRELAPRDPWVRAAAVLLVLLDPLTRHALLEAHVHVAVAAAFLLPPWAWLRAGRAAPGPASPGPSPTTPDPRGVFALGLALGVLWATAVVGPVWTALWFGVLLAHPAARAGLGRAHAGWALAGLGVGLLVLWPAGIFKLGLLQTHGLRLYAVVFQDGREWNSAGAALGALLRRHPALFGYAALAAAACVVGAARRRRAFALGSATLAFLAVVLPFAIIDRYLLPLVPLGLAAGVALLPDGAREAGLARRWAVGATALVVAAWGLGAGFPYPDEGWSDALRDEHARVAGLAAGGAEVLAEGGHVFRYYARSGAPAAGAIRPVMVDYDGRRLLLRDGVRWDTVAPDRRAWVVLQRRAGAEPEVFALLQARCRRADFRTHVHFGCGGVDGE